MSTRHAMILAAGYGSRLEPEEGHKLLVDIGGQSLLAHHLRNFEHLGVEHLVVVTGYRGDALADAIATVAAPKTIDIQCAPNPDFDAGNGGSVLAGVDALVDGDDVPPFWLTMSDHLYDPQLFVEGRPRLEAIDDRWAGALVVDHKLDRIFDMPDATKVRLRSGDGFDIGKQLGSFDVVDTGLFWCDRDFVDALRTHREETGDCSTSDAVRRLVADNRFGFVDIGPYLWQDVDTPEAREHAERLVAEEFGD